MSTVLFVPSWTNPTAMTIREIVRFIDAWAPSRLQEDYDNSGLLCGDPDATVDRALMTLDVTEAVVGEAVEKKAGLIIAHHPLIFKGLKRLTPDHWVQRTLIKAIRNDVAILAVHTNLDHVRTGVNAEIGRRLGVEEPTILRPLRDGLCKLAVFTPHDHADAVRAALFEAGAGHVGDYDSASFNIDGRGSFRGDASTNPAIGEPGRLEWVDEVRIEVLLPRHRQGAVVRALLDAHPYEEVAYDIVPLLNENPYEGSGMVGDLADPLEPRAFLAHLRDTFGCTAIRHTDAPTDAIRRVAWCGGSGFFLLEDAVRAGADAFVTGDIKYHDWFEVDDRLLLADIGHYESERFTIDLLADAIRRNFRNFAPLLTAVNTNPVRSFTETDR